MANKAKDFHDKQNEVMDKYADFNERNCDLLTKNERKELYRAPLKEIELIKDKTVKKLEVLNKEYPTDEERGTDFLKKRIAIDFESNQAMTEVYKSQEEGMYNSIKARGLNSESLEKERSNIQASYAKAVQENQEHKEDLLRELESRKQTASEMVDSLRDSDLPDYTNDDE